MKDKIIIFIIGLLLGAVIATGAFYVYTINNNTCNNSNQNTMMNGGEPPAMPSGQMEEPPEKPNGENGSPPEKPNDNNSQNSNTQDNN